MEILVLGGTRFFGVPMVRRLIENGHDVTIATRGTTPDCFGDSVKRIMLDRTDEQSVKKALSGQYFDTVIDKIAYSSNDVKYLLDNVDCGRYVLMSTTAVYQPLTVNTAEDFFDPMSGETEWCKRWDFPYDETKRHAERAVFQHYADIPSAAVRYPFVVGPDDYTQRLRFYVENTIKGAPMHIDNLNAQMSFIRSDEAGEFIAHIAQSDFTGAVNGASEGTVSVGEIIEFVERTTGSRAIISADGEPAPYNGTNENSVSTDRAAALGFRFSNVREWIFDLTDAYIKKITAE